MAKKEKDKPSSEIVRQHIEKFLKSGGLVQRIASGTTGIEGNKPRDLKLSSKPQTELKPT